MILQGIQISRFSSKSHNSINNSLCILTQINRNCAHWLCNKPNSYSSNSNNHNSCSSHNNNNNRNNNSCLNNSKVNNHLEAAIMLRSSRINGHKFTILDLIQHVRQRLLWNQHLWRRGTWRLVHRCIHHLHNSCMCSHLRNNFSKNNNSNNS